jgi:uncharacterized protein YegP (UPF0339 family)
MGVPNPEFYIDAAGEHRWRAWAANAEIIGASSEGFRRRDGAVANAKTLGLALGQPDLSVDYYRDADGHHRWRVWSGNARVVGASSEGFVRRADAEENVRLLAAALSRWIDAGYPV